jgi:hypothetical protein
MIEAYWTCFSGSVTCRDADAGAGRLDDVMVLIHERQKPAKRPWGDVESGLGETVYSRWKRQWHARRGKIPGI